MSLTNTWETNIGNAVLRNTAFSAPSTVYVALFTADPGETGSTANEVTGSGYSRQAITFGAPTTDGEFVNSGDVVFTATGSWGTVSHVGLMTAASGGTVIMKGAIVDSLGAAAPKSIGSGDSLRFNTGDFRATFA